MKIVIVDDDFESMSSRIAYFLIRANDAIRFRKELPFPDLRIVAVPLFTQVDLIDLLREKWSTPLIEFWEERKLFFSSEALVKHMEEHLNSRDLIIWDYFMPNVGWVADSLPKSLATLASIRERRACQAIVVTLTKYRIHPTEVLDFARYFSIDELVAADDEETPQRLVALVRQLNTEVQLPVEVWHGVTGELFSRLHMDEREIGVRRRFVDWYLDERTGILSIDGCTFSIPLRNARDTYRTFWNLVVNPTAAELRFSSSRLAQRLHIIRGWFPASSEHVLTIKSVRGVGYELEKGIKVLIVTAADVLDPDARAEHVTGS